MLITYYSSVLFVHFTDEVSFRTKKCLGIESTICIYSGLYTSLGSRGPNQIAEHHYRCGLSHEESHITALRWLGLVVCVRQLVIHKDSIEHETV